MRWGLLALVLCRLAVKLGDAGIPGGFTWLRRPNELARAALTGVAVGVLASAAMYGVSALEQSLGVLGPRFWATANDGASPLFAFSAGLRNLAGEEVFARLGVQSLVLYALRRVRGNGVIAVVASSLVFEFA